MIELKNKSWMNENGVVSAHTIFGRWILNCLQNNIEMVERRQHLSISRFRQIFSIDFVNFYVFFSISDFLLIEFGVWIGHTHTRVHWHTKQKSSLKAFVLRFPPFIVYLYPKRSSFSNEKSNRNFPMKCLRNEISTDVHTKSFGLFRFDNGQWPTTSHWAHNDQQQQQTKANGNNDNGDSNGNNKCQIGIRVSSVDITNGRIEWERAKDRIRGDLNLVDLRDNNFMHGRNELKINTNETWAKTAINLSAFFSFEFFVVLQWNRIEFFVSFSLPSNSFCLFLFCFQSFQIRFFRCFPFDYSHSVYLSS